jgi:hypothetical protein
MIEVSFNADPNAGRVDLFQRPMAAGGYYETMKSGIALLFPPFLLSCSYSIVVQEVVSFNGQAYGYNGGEQQQINQAQSFANSYESQGNYRQAWSQYRIMYLTAVSP